MRYEYLDEGVTADVTLRAEAGDLEALFTAAADATANLMVENLDEVKPATARSVELEADALDLLLFRFLGEMIFYKDAESLLTRAARVKIEAKNGGYRLRAELRGEPLDPSRHRLAADVKAVTLHGLRVEHTAGWSATVTLDV